MKYLFISHPVLEFERVLCRRHLRKHHIVHRVFIGSDAAATSAWPLTSVFHSLNPSRGLVLNLCFLTSSLLLKIILSCQCGGFLNAPLGDERRWLEHLICKLVELTCPSNQNKQTNKQTNNNKAMLVKHKKEYARQKLVLLIYISEKAHRC